MKQKIKSFVRDLGISVIGGLIVGQMCTNPTIVPDSQKTVIECRDTVIIINDNHGIVNIDFH